MDRLIRQQRVSLALQDRIQSTVQSLPVVAKGEVDAEEMCAICLMPFSSVFEEEQAEAEKKQNSKGASPQGISDGAGSPEGQEDLVFGVTKLEHCGHLFCRRDLVEWIKGFHGSCPACRHPFLDIKPPSESDDESSDGGEYVPGADDFEDEDDTFDFTDGFSDAHDIDIMDEDGPEDHESEPPLDGEFEEPEDSGITPEFSSFDDMDIEAVEAMASARWEFEVNEREMQNEHDASYDLADEETSPDFCSSDAFPYGMEDEHDASPYHLAEGFDDEEINPSDFAEFTGDNDIPDDMQNLVEGLDDEESNPSDFAGVAGDDHTPYDMQDEHDALPYHFAGEFDHEVNPSDFVEPSGDDDNFQFSADVDCEEHGSRYEPTEEDFDIDYDGPEFGFTDGESEAMSSEPDISVEEPVDIFEPPEGDFAVSVHEDDEIEVSYNEKGLAVDVTETLVSGDTI